MKSVMSVTNANILNTIIGIVKVVQSLVLNLWRG